MRETRTLEGLEALETEATTFVRGLSPDTERAMLVTLSGGLGAGKTTFTQAAARALGVTDAVTSPTFVLAKSYPLPDGNAFARLVHIDAYRLEEGRDLASIAFDELLREPGTLIMLEWPEMVIDGLPPADVAITLDTIADSARTISYA